MKLCDNMHLTVGIYGDQELAKKLGKKGTINDIAIYNHGSSEGIFTYVCPNSDKIQTLLQTLGMIDVPVIVVKNLTKEIGEIIIAVDEMNFPYGFIIGNNGIEKIIKNTSLEKFSFVSEEHLWQELLKLNIERSGPLNIPIDNYFNVKGVGTVILGIIKSGIVKKYDKVMVEPIGKEVVVKGIQSQDKDYDEAEPGTRVGLNLKGIDVDELKRGYVICNKIKKSTNLKIKFKKSRFCKELKQGMPIFVAVGLQVVASTIESISNDNLIIKINSPIAYFENQKCIIASQTETLPRVIGSGIIE